MATTNPSRRAARSVSDDSESASSDGGVGLNHLTVVPANFDHDE